MLSSRQIEMRRCQIRNTTATAERTLVDESEHTVKLVASQGNPGWYGVKSNIAAHVIDQQALPDLYSPGRQANEAVNIEEATVGKAHPDIGV